MCFRKVCTYRLMANRISKLVSESMCMVVIASCLYSQRLPVYLHSPTDYRSSSTAVRHCFTWSGLLSGDGLIWKRLRGSWTKWTSWEIANLCFCCILLRWCCASLPKLREQRKPLELGAGDTWGEGMMLNMYQWIIMQRQIVWIKLQSHFYIQEEALK